MKPGCEHMNFDNEKDCQEDAEMMCMCCSVPLCSEHARGNCQYGGMGFIDID